MRFAAIFMILLSLCLSAMAQSLTITDVEETGSNVFISIETDIATPFEVMAGVSLVGQAPDDIWIGNSERVSIRSRTQKLKISTKKRGEQLPSGIFEAEVSFYPRWGADIAPPATKKIAKEIHATQEFKLIGSGGSAAVTIRKNELQSWVMENTAIGDSFSLVRFQSKLGSSEKMVVTNRTGIIVAHYFPDADVTLFENTLKRTLVTWRLGRQNRL